MPKPYIQGDVVDVLPVLIRKNAKFDLIISDPPYTYFQSTRTYGGEKKKRHQMITPIKEMYDALLVPGGDIISFGFNSTGLGKERGYVKKLLLIINSGSGHNDIAITEETKCGEGGDCDIYAVKEQKARKRKKIAQSQFF
jgi:hypothetical protein